LYPSKEDVFRSALKKYRKITALSFGFPEGKFVDEARSQFVTTIEFMVSGVGLDHSTLAVKGVAKVLWSTENGTGKANEEWRIASWENLTMQEESCLGSFFSDETPSIVVGQHSDQISAELERCRHEEKIQELLTKGAAALSPKYQPYFTFSSAGQHPGVSVCDFDSDGLDDLFVCRKWSRAILLKNQGGGKFSDVTLESGLVVEGLATSAIFADYDNDGDEDVFVARSLERSLYFENRGGRFSETSETAFPEPLPYLATSVSAADYDQDGLLDIYVSTYGFTGRLESASEWGAEFLPADKLPQFLTKLRKSNRWVDLSGPPNILYRNLGGGKFEISEKNEELESWRNTFQATWIDFDEDGDQDIYLANDFAPDNFFENQDGTFVDVSQKFTGNDMQGFGMGVSFGDYDNDGDFDLYVSNMYSKAGKRITKQIEGIGEAFVKAAKGNLLFERTASGYDLVSGATKDKVMVAKAGWSWGGQFSDFNNDGFLDLYVPNGYFSAPEKFRSEHDL